jgi:hypothetical protein
VETELEFTKKKIEENFSNYSAFHQRSALLKLAGRGVIEELANELSTVENAVFTEPDDQSAWWYHQFLLNWAKEAVFTGADSGAFFISISNFVFNVVKFVFNLCDVRHHHRSICLVHFDSVLSTRPHEKPTGDRAQLSLGYALCGEHHSTFGGLTQ